MSRQIARFREVQRFRQWWLWLLVLIPPALCLWAIIQQLVLGIPWGNNPASDAVLIVLVAVFGVGLPVFIYGVSLTTLVWSEGVYVRFFPFHLKWLVFPSGEIEAYEVCTYSPLKDYGGWGIRYGLKSKAYSVTGNRGVVLKLKNGKTVLIGSQSAELLRQALAELTNAGEA